MLRDDDDCPGRRLSGCSKRGWTAERFRRRLRRRSRWSCTCCCACGTCAMTCGRPGATCAPPNSPCAPVVQRFPGTLVRARPLRGARRSAGDRGGGRRPDGPAPRRRQPDELVLHVDDDVTYAYIAGATIDAASGVASDGDCSRGRDSSARGAFRVSLATDMTAAATPRTRSSRCARGGAARRWSR